MQLSVRISGDGLQVILESTGVHKEQSFGAGSWTERKLARPWAADTGLPTGLHWPPLAEFLTTETFRTRVFPPRQWMPGGFHSLYPTLTC